jgi:hypothetical protein
MLPRRVSLALLALAPFALATPALASFPVSVWAIPDSVVIEGEDSKVPTVTITGFMMAFIDKSSTEPPGDYGGYSIPRWGEMHYECPTGMAKTCLMEWDDIAKKIGAEDCVGWGSQDQPPGLIQPLYAEKWVVDDYPFGTGVVTGFTPCQALDAAYVPKPPPPMPDPGPEVGEDTGSGPDVDAGPMPDVDAGPMPDVDGGAFDGGPTPDVDGGAVDGGPGPDIADWDVPPWDTEDVPPWDAEDVPPWDAEDVPPWDAGDAGPPVDAEWDVPPWDAEDVPPWDAEDVPPWDVPPWDVEDSGPPPDATWDAEDVPEPLDVPADGQRTDDTGTTPTDATLDSGAGDASRPNPDVVPVEDTTPIDDSAEPAPDAPGPDAPGPDITADAPSGVDATPDATPRRQQRRQRRLRRSPRHRRRVAVGAGSGPGRRHPPPLRTMTAPARAGVAESPEKIRPAPMPFT